MSAFERSWEFLSGSLMHNLESRPEGGGDGAWCCLAAFEDNCVPVSLHVSTRTGIRVCIAKVSGPIVDGYMCLATEGVATQYSHPDDGLAHTLEHLTFLGSSEWPYKGVLDQLANRAFARGTNAWTDTDHTAYTITTAESQGFLSMIPVLLDHILFPTLTDAAFATEVHHVGSDGNDHGVVYQEMLSRENTCDELCSVALNAALHPHSGYGANTGGRVANIRSIDATAVRRYHADYYRPDNLCIIVAGEVEAADVFAKLESAELKILARREQVHIPPRTRVLWTDETERPETDSPTGLVERLEAFGAGTSEFGESPFREVEVFFPSEREDTGMVMIGWKILGKEGSRKGDLQHLAALRIMWLYLTDSPVSPLRHAFVEQEDALCGSINFEVHEGRPGMHTITFADCDASRLAEVQPLFLSTVRSAIKNIDVTRLQRLIHRERLRHFSNLAEEPLKERAWPLLAHFLYGGRGENEAAELFDRVVNASSRLQALEEAAAHAQEGAAAEYLKKFIMDAFASGNVCVVGKPSTALAERAVIEERERVSAQIQRLGPEGLAAAGEAIRIAKEANERPCPPEVLEALSSPSVDNVPPVPVLTVRCRPGESIASVNVISTGDVPESIKTSLHSHLIATPDAAKTLPFTLQYDHVRSEFIEVSIWLDTSSLPTALRLHLPVFLDSLFELPVRLSDGEILPYEEVARQLASDAVYFWVGLGSPQDRVSSGSFETGSFSEMVCLKIQVEASKYHLAALWVQRLLYQTEFSVERLRTSCTRLLAELPSVRRDGAAICRAALNTITFQPEHSCCVAAGPLRQSNHLGRFASRLSRDRRSTPAAVVAEFETLRTTLCSPSNMTIHIVGDILAQKDPVSPWHRLTQIRTSQSASASQLRRTTTPARLTRDLRVDAGTELRGNTLIILTPNTESGFLSQATPCDVGFADTELHSLLVAVEYLAMLEGDFWRVLRGSGLAYGYQLRFAVDKGQLYFTLYDATDVVSAFAAAATVVREYCSGEREVDEVALEAARRSVMFEYIEMASTVSTAASQSLLNLFRGEEAGFNTRVVAAAAKVTTSAVLASMRRYVSYLFDSDRSTMVAVVGSSRENETLEGVRSLQRRFVATTNLDKIFSASISRGGSNDGLVINTSSSEEENSSSGSGSEECADHREHAMMDVIQPAGRKELGVKRIGLYAVIGVGVVVVGLLWRRKK